MGTSTRRTDAVRRALNRPNSDAAAASNGTAMAVVSDSEGRPQGSDASRATSRRRVSTSSIEKCPSAIMPAQVQRSAMRRSGARRPRKAVGMSTQTATSQTTSSTETQSEGSDGTRRQPMYRCSRPRSQKMGIARRW